MSGRMWPLRPLIFLVTSAKQIEHRLRRPHRNSIAATAPASTAVAEAVPEPPIPYPSNYLANQPGCENCLRAISIYILYLQLIFFLRSSSRVT